MFRLYGRLALLAAGLCLPAAAIAQQAVTNTLVNLRAGPDLDYPLLATFPAGTPLLVEGCESDYRWCDVVAGDLRGWMAAEFISYPYDNQPVPVMTYGALIGLPIITFSLGAYWDRYYAGQPFYYARHRWEGHPAYVYRPAPGFRPGPGFHPGPGYHPGPRPDFRPGPSSGPRPDDRPGPRPDYRPDYRSGPRSEDRPGPRPGSQPGVRPGSGSPSMPGYSPGARPGNPSGPAPALRHGAGPRPDFQGGSPQGGGRPGGSGAGPQSGAQGGGPGRGGGSGGPGGPGGPGGHGR